MLEVLKNLGADFFCLQVFSYIYFRIEFQLFDYFLLNNVFCYADLFQEVDEFDSFYKGKMQELGYSSIYMKRSGDKKRDGCGLFYKHDRYVHLFCNT
jgi:hypothetical protein